MDPNLECILNQNPHVLSSIIFGRGKLTAGVIVDPLPAYKFNPANMKALEDFRNTIWYIYLSACCYCSHLTETSLYI